MIDVKEIFGSKHVIEGYREKFFHNELKFKTGLQRPVLFLADLNALKQASYFSVHKIEDIDYDIYVFSYSSTVLFYFINIKAPFYSVMMNGIIIRRRPPNETDKLGVKVKYAIEHFQVISNQLATCTIFARDISTDPTT